VCRGVVKGSGRGSYGSSKVREDAGQQSAHLKIVTKGRTIGEVLHQKEEEAGSNTSFTLKQSQLWVRTDRRIPSDKRGRPERTLQVTCGTGSYSPAKDRGIWPVWSMSALSDKGGNGRVRRIQLREKSLLPILHENRLKNATRYQQGELQATSKRLPTAEGDRHDQKLGSMGAGLGVTLICREDREFCDRAGLRKKRKNGGREEARRADFRE